MVIKTLQSNGEKAKKTYPSSCTSDSTGGLDRNSTTEQGMYYNIIVTIFSMY